MTSRRFLARSAAGLLPLLAGCGHAPEWSLLGSYFPVWLFCIIAGILFSFLLYLLLRRMDLAHQLAPPLLVYPSLAVLLCLALWLILFS